MNNLADARAHWRLLAWERLIAAKSHYVAGRMSRRCYLMTRRHIGRECWLAKRLEWAYYGGGE